jgi:apolipoprotein N-acyltransferase
VPRRLILLPFLSSALYILSFPNFNVSWFAWIALIPLVFVAQHPATRHSFLWGWLAGTLAYGGILYWIIVTYQAAHLSMALAILSLILLAAYLGLFWGAWAWLISRNKNVVWGAATWVALEYLRTYLFSGFPWALLADSQVKNLALIQIASMTGVYGVSFLVVLINLALASRRSRTVISAGTLILAVCLYGRYQLIRPNGASRRLIKVALLQGSIDQYKKWNRAYVEEIEKTYESLIRQTSLYKPNLIVWPETSVPGYLLQDKPLRAWLDKIVHQSQTNNLVGAPIEINEYAYNSSFSINSESIIEGEYDKRHLVPFGEVVPWSSFLGRFIRVLNDLGGFTAGHRNPVLQAGDIRVGVNICYEAIFPNLVRQSVKQGAEVIANLTNDGWYMKTAAPYQHWAPNIYRAVENRRYVVRADNTGVSGIIDPNGRVIVASPLFEPVVVTGTVEPLNGLTIYSRYGDLFAWLCVFFCALSGLLYILRLP